MIAESESGRFKIWAVNFVAVAALALAACSSPPTDRINMMPVPEVFEEGTIDPFVTAPRFDPPNRAEVLYATDREPSVDERGRLRYLNERGNVLRLGVAQVEPADPNLTWEDARRISLLRSLGGGFPIRFTGATEFGVLDRTATELFPPEALQQTSAPANQVFAEKINAWLAKSKRKHVYIYVHGYRVIFENPTLVATELWHFLGYQGVFVAFAWPSTPSRFAYLRDLDTAVGYARHLRVLLEYLAEETDAEQIHLVGYSMGARIVLRALKQLALMHHGLATEEIRQKLRIGHVVLAASDMDREVAAMFLADGLLEVPAHLTVYLSSRDRALGVVRFLTRRKRLGQLWAEGAPSPEVAAYLHQREADISVVYVTDAEGSTEGHGHAYFRDSPWVSSDILMALAYGLLPADRGLQRSADGSPHWALPGGLRRPLAQRADRGQSRLSQGARAGQREFLMMRAILGVARLSGKSSNRVFESLAGWDAALDALTPGTKRTLIAPT